MPLGRFWQYVYGRLPALLPVTIIDQDAGTLGGDLRGRQFRVSLYSPWQLVYATSRVEDLLEVLASIAQMDRKRVLAALRADYEQSAPLPAVIVGGGSPYALDRIELGAALGGGRS